MRIQRVLKIGICFFAAAATFPLAAVAGTVAWYHFSEMVPGAASTASTVFENAANNGVMQAYPATTVNERRTDLVGVAAWPEKMLLCDGTNGIDVVNSGGCGFYLNTDVGIVKVSDVSVIAETDNGDSVEKSFTMEFFMQCLSLPTNPTSTGNNQPTTRTVLSRTSSGGAWWKLMTNNGAFKFHASSDSTMSENWSFNIGNAANIRKWHHFAVTYDASTRTYAFYADYVKIFSKQLVAKLAVGDAPIVLGGSTQSSSVYGGGIGNKGTSSLADVNFMVDEFRISDAVLAPQEFMGWKLASKSDVVVRLGFDDLSEAGLDTFPLPLGWNSASHPAVNKATVSVNSGAIAAATSADEAVAVVHDGIRDEGDDNFGALVLSGNESRQSAKITISETGLTTSGFTAETFVKFNPDNYVFSGDSGYLFEASGSWYVRFLAGGGVQGSVGGGQFVFVNKGYWGSPAEGKNIDGNWHHVAFVYDPSAATKCSLYIDYVYVGGTATALSAAADGTLNIAGSHWDSTTGVFGDALLDEVKVTRRALKPWEFQRGDYVPGPTLLMADFDGGEGLVYTPVISSLTSSGFNGDTHPAQDGAIPFPQTVTGDKTVVNESNTASMLFSAQGYVLFANPSVLAPELTVEFFVKNKSSGKAGLIALYDGNSVSDAIWGLELDTDGQTPVFVVGQGGSQTRVAFAGVALDRRWHHVAVVMKTPDEGTSTIKLLLDGENVSTQTLPVRIRQTCATPRVWLGRATDNSAFRGYMDELRISEGELSVDDLMQMKKRNGLVLVFR